MRMKIARREAKESQHWLELILEGNLSFKYGIEPLLKEVEELIKILSTIIIKMEQKPS